MEQSQTEVVKPKRRWRVELIKLIFWSIPLVLSITVWLQYQKIDTAFDTYQQLNNNDQKKFLEQSNDFQTKVIVLEKNMSTAQEALNSLQIQVTKNQEADKRRRFTLLEVKNLMQLAQWQFLVTHQPIPTQNLLKVALDRINTLSDPKLTVLQQSLTQMLSQVSAVSKIDRLAVSNQLKVLGEQIAHAPPIPVTKPTEPMNNANLSWQQQLQKTWQGLEKIIVIRRHEQSVQPLLTQQEKTLFDLNIQLLVQQANLGLWQADNTLYQSSLERIKTWVLTYYGSDKNTLKSIEKLQTLNVTGPQFNMDLILNQIEQLIATN